MEMWETDPMTYTPAARRLKRAMEKRDAGLAAVQDAFEIVVAEELAKGLKPAEAAEILGVHYETVRRIARKREVARLREPTVTSRQPAARSTTDSPAAKAAD